MSEPIRSLIDDYRNSVSQIDRQIEHLASGGRIYPLGENPQEATASWLTKLRKFRQEYLILIAQLQKIQQGQADQTDAIIAFCRQQMALGQSAQGALMEVQRQFRTAELSKLHTCGDRAAIRLAGNMYVSYEEPHGWVCLASAPDWL